MRALLTINPVAPNQRWERVRGGLRVCLCVRDVTRSGGRGREVDDFLFFLFLIFAFLVRRDWSVRYWSWLDGWDRMG